MDLPERLLKPLTSAYWVIRSLPHLGRLTTIERELISLDLLEIDIVDMDDPPEDRRYEIKISDAGTRLVEENNILALIESGCASGVVYGNKVNNLIKKVPKEQLPRLLASDNSVVRRIAKVQLEDGVD